MKQIIIAVIFSLFIQNFVFAESEIDSTAQKTEKPNFTFTSILPKSINFGFNGLFSNRNALASNGDAYNKVESGDLPGFYIGATTNQDFPLFVSFNLNYIHGSETYQIVSSTITTFVNYDFEIDYALNLIDRSTDALALTPFIGYSYRYWLREYDGNFSNISEEDYFWQDFYLGMALDFSIKPDVKFGIRWQKNFMSNLSVDYFVPKATTKNYALGNRDGFKIEIPIIYNYNKIWSLNFKPYYEEFSFGYSNSYALDEPSSTNKNFGIMIGTQYNF